MITAAHIIPHSCKREAVTAAMNFDVDAVQNGMLICKTFEMAFDSQEWCFVPSLDAKSPFQIMLCDRSMAESDVVLLDNRNSKMSEQPVRLKWGDLDGLPVSLPSCVSRRALVMHSVHALKKFGISSAGMNYQIWQVRDDSPGSIRDWLKDVELPEEAAVLPQPPPMLSQRRKRRSARKLKAQPPKNKKKEKKSLHNNLGEQL